MKKQVTLKSLVNDESAPTAAGQNAVSSRKSSFKLMLCIALVFCGLLSNAQVLVPYSGNNSILCGYSTQLMDHAGPGQYSDNAYGYTVINAGFGAQITLNGTFDMESCCDRLYIYDGVGTGGTLLQQYGNTGTGTINFTGAAGQTLTVLFDTDGSVVGPGFDLLVTFNGPCSNIPCATSPAPNTVITPTNPICPGSNVNLGAAAFYTVNGITYQWATSTNSVGPWTPVPTGGTNPNYTALNVTANTWYQVVATCTNGGAPTPYTPGLIQVAQTTTNSVPYEEGFEGAPSSSNQLPNCSWNRTNIGNCKTSNTGVNNASPNNGNGFAYFDGNSCNTNSYYFYSNGIQLNAGITYSASVWYKTSGWSAYSQFSLHYGPNQSPAGLIQLGNVNNPNSSTYKSVSNTFQVATSGIYYMAIRATDNCGYDELSFDDLSVIAPCTYSNNAANLTLTAPAAICAGQSANLTAAGVSSYSWNTGATSAAIVVSPTVTSTYSVTGTNALSGCALVMTAPIIVNPLPGVQIYVANTSICEGESVTLSAFGSATSFTWTAGSNPNQSMIQDAPMTTTTYSVIGSNSYGCASIASQVITVNQLPAITVNGNTSICKGEPGTLTGVGGDSYTWASPSNFFQTNPITPYPQVNTTYTVTGTDVNGCEGTAIVNMIVNACTGIATVNATIENLNLYPNPNNGEFTIELNNGHSKTIEVMDLTGRIIVANNTDKGVINVNISQLANGIYYVKVKSDNAVEVLKVVKQ